MINHPLVYKKDTPFFSVIMNCHNGALFLQEAIESVYTQEFDDWEIIFFDNASTDDSAEIAKSFDTRIKYFYNPDLVPLGSARNRAIKHANGAYLAFLDCDDLWMSSKLLLQQQALVSPTTERGYAFCYTDAMRIDQFGEDIMPYSQERELAEGNAFLALMRDCFISMSSCVINRQTCLSLGGFDESLEYVEEWDLWLKAAKRYDLAFVPEYLTRIRFHSDNTSKDYQAQGREVMTILRRTQVKLTQLSEKQQILNWFQIRFLIIHTVHCFKNNLIEGLVSTFSLAGLCLRHPRVSLQFLKKYLSVDLLHFFYTKYFKKNKSDKNVFSTKTKE